MDKNKISKKIMQGSFIGFWTSVVATVGLLIAPNPYNDFPEVRKYNRATETIKYLKTKRESILPVVHYQSNMKVEFDQEKADSLDTMIETVEEDLKEIEKTSTYQNYQNFDVMKSHWGGFCVLGMVIGGLMTAASSVYRFYKKYD